MANRWGNSVNSERLFSWAPKSLLTVTAALKLKHFLLGRKVMTNLDSVLKSRDISLPTEVHLVKATVFSSSHVQVWELDHKEGLMLKNGCFQTVVLRRLLRVPWTAWRLNQSDLKEINPEYSLEGLILKLKLQYFGHLMWRADSLEKTLLLGKIEGRRIRGWQRWDGCMTLLAQWTWFEENHVDSEGQRSLVFCNSWGYRCAYELETGQQ